MSAAHINQPDKVKTCTGPCKKELPCTTEYFHIHNVKMPGGGTWRGLRPRCKTCRNAYKKEYMKRGKTSEKKDSQTIK